MFKEFFAHTQEHLLDLPLFAMSLFIVMFSVVVWRIWRRGPDDAQHERMAQLPLQDEFSNSNKMNDNLGGSHV